MNNEEKFTVPAATLVERPAEYELRAEVPGVGKEDAELHMEGKTLTLKTHAKYQNPAGFKVAAQEFERVNYSMSVDLPEMADPSALSAKLENGVLTVIVKKRPETQAKKIDILYTATPVLEKTGRRGIPAAPSGLGELRAAPCSALPAPERARAHDGDEDDHRRPQRGHRVVDLRDEEDER